MSVIGSNILAGASGNQGGGYNLTRSLRFRSSASAYLNRTPVSAGNLRTWTWSAWVKRGELGNKNLFACTSTQHYVGFNGGNGLNFQFDAGGVNDYKIFTNQVFRDPSAWYHIVAVWDTTNATSSSRMRLYVNGEQITSLSASNYPPQNYDGSINSTNAHSLGSYGTASYFDGYLTEVNFIDGQALTPSSFGATSPTTGVWQPKKYAGTYGTNGFYLPFTNNSTTTTLGNDFSGNGNNWTTNNISLTAGATYDSMTDVPTLTSATASNFCTLNPIFDPNYLSATNQSNVNMSGGNLNYGTGGRNGFGTIAPSSGKYYWEMSNTSNTSASVVVTGIATIDARSSIYGIYYNSTNGNKGQGFLASGATETAYGATWTDNDIIGVALDCDTNTVTFYKNNASQGAITNSNLAGKQIVAWMQSGNNVNSMTGWFNFGQRPFAYTPPTGYVALNTYNLPTPTIGATASTQANKYFDVVTWTGTGVGSRAVTGLNFNPDLVWLKSRSNAFHHQLHDSVRGATAGALYSSLTNAQDSNYPITSFDSNGFTLGNSASLIADSFGSQNYNGYTYVGWQWKENVSAGFDVATATSSALSVVTYNHNLGVAPSFVISKSRSTVAPWLVYHKSLGNNQYTVLNSTAAAASLTGVFSGTSTQFTVTNQDPLADYVSYLFAEVAGYSKFGSYTGNGSSTDGPFVFTGFRPRYIMFKGTTLASSWLIYDTARSTINPVPVTGGFLLANSSAAEAGTGDSAAYVDILSNGFKIRNNSGFDNNSGSDTYIYAAFAENPYKYSNAR